MKSAEELKKEIYSLNIRLHCLAEELSIKAKDIDRLYLYKLGLEAQIKESKNE